MTLSVLHQTGPHLPVAPEIGIAVIVVGWLIFTVIALDIARNYELPPH